MRTRGVARLEVKELDNEALVLVLGDLMHMRFNGELSDKEFRSEMYDVMDLYYYGSFEYSREYGKL